MKYLRRKHILFSLAALLLIAGLVAWPVVREVRQEAKDRALIAAVKRNDTHAVVHLLDSGSDANARALLKETRSFWQVCWDMVQGRCQEKSYAPTALLLSVDKNGFYLYLDDTKAENVAAQTTIIRVLLEHGANPNFSDEHGFSPLWHALNFDEPQIDLLLIQHGAKLNGLFVDALCSVNDIRVLQAMLDRGANVNEVSLRGMTALIYASNMHSVSKVKFLLAHNANVTMKDVDGYSALNYAMHSNYEHYMGEPPSPDNPELVIHLLRQAGAR